jgi:hypothetical protein
LKNSGGTVIATTSTNWSPTSSPACAGSYAVEVDTWPVHRFAGDVGDDTLDNDCSPESVPCPPTTPRT